MGVVIVSLVLIFILDLPGRIIDQLGSVGVSMSVAVNPINTMALQLRERAAELERERASIEIRKSQIEKDRSSYRVLAYGALLGLVALSIIFARHLYYDRK